MRSLWAGARLDKKATFDREKLTLGELHILIIQLEIYMSDSKNSSTLMIGPLRA